MSDHPSEAYRFALDARRVYTTGGGGRCTVLVRRVGDHVELLFHADPKTGAVLPPRQALELAEALRQAASSPP